MKERFTLLKQSKMIGAGTLCFYRCRGNLYTRTGKAVNNFEMTLPDYQSDLVKSVFKDPYHFDFLMLSSKVKEIEIEKLLTQKITEFLLELGKVFALVGRQYKIEIDNLDYKIDLLFYYTILHAYVLLELKAGEFMPEYNFFLFLYRRCDRTEVITYHFIKIYFFKRTEVLFFLLKEGVFALN